METIKFKSGNLQLTGTLVWPDVLKDENPAILFIHGLTGTKEKSYQYANSLAKLGYVSLLFDMRGHGESEGDINTATIKDFLTDCLSAFDYLINIKKIDKGRISIIGNSLGGYLGVVLTSKRKVKKLAIRAPADYPNNVFDKFAIEHGADNPSVMEWRKQLKDYNKSMALEAIHAFDGHILIIESENDDRVPHATLDNYINAASDKNKLTHVILQGASHSIGVGKFRNKVEKILLTWFN